MERRWHKPNKKKRPRSRKVYLSSDEVHQLLIKKLSGKLDSSFQIYLADEKYYCPPMKDVREIIENSSLDRKSWVEERFDCDDFAIVLKSHFAESAYANGKRRAAHAMGIVWGIFDEPHAINWVITSNKQLHFIEPQTDEIFSPRKSDHGIWFLMS